AERLQRKEGEEVPSLNERAPSLAHEDQLEAVQAEDHRYAPGQGEPRHGVVARVEASPCGCESRYRERYGERQGPVVAVVDPGIEPSPAHPEGLVPDDVQPFRGEGPRGDLGVGLWRRRGRQIPSGAHMDRPEEKDERRWT